MRLHLLQAPAHLPEAARGFPLELGRLNLDVTRALDGTAQRPHRQLDPFEEFHFLPS
jgi:hypothetical protein